RSGNTAAWFRRVAIGFAVAAVGLGCVVWAPLFAALVAVIAVGCLWEFDKLALRKGTPVELAVAAPAVLAYVVLTAFGLIHRFESLLLAATIIATFAFSTFAHKGHYLARSAFTVLAVLYIGKLVSYFVTIRGIPEAGAWFTVYAIFIIAFTDIFAMLVGVAIGRTPLTRISPRKTVEGALGGFAAGIGVGIAFGMLPQIGFSWWEGAIVGAITSIAAQAGDLVESALKRDARVKNAGSAIGTHGGVLDRFDSYLFAGPAFYLALWMLGVVRHGTLPLP
ncbi:MAG: phosphatidate cytidylyltransferase, partial [Candidatus Eremiobacteraeota bacterium]|nr:phosphatidate cytidylyltransferase [Candidatus Eremiobacteraeota bacterium]